VTCLVCQATWPGGGSTACPQCGYDAAAPGAKDPARVLAARDEFRARTTAFAPQSRVRLRDRLVPWGGLALGLLLLVFWLRACSTGGTIF
jgi:hypothetical protein